MKPDHLLPPKDTSQRNCLIACEILWDCFPSGNYLGGATTNVAYHLNHLPVMPIIVSSVGDDVLGNEALELISKKWGCDIKWIRILDDVPTGKVVVHLDEGGDANYTIESPAAWDYISLEQIKSSGVENIDAFVYGSVSLRSAYNRRQVNNFLEGFNGLKCFDANLRPPHNSEEMVLEYAKKADFVKLNDHELNVLSHLFSLEDDLRKQILMMAEILNIEMLCITRADKSALMFCKGDMYEGKIFPVSVQDTVGGGDAFFASMISYLLSDSFTPKEALDNATRLGSWVVTQKGAQPDYSRFR